MDDIKTYSYTKEIKFNFKKIADDYSLSEKTPFQTCLNSIESNVYYIDREHYVVDNVDEIATDLFYYLRRNKEELQILTPQIKIELSSAFDKIDSYVQAETPQIEIVPYSPSIKVCADWRVKKAWEHLRNIPFLKEKGTEQKAITLQTEIELGYALYRLNNYINDCRCGYSDYSTTPVADKGVEEAWEILRNIPFLKEN